MWLIVLLSYCVSRAETQGARHVGVTNQQLDLAFLNRGLQQEEISTPTSMHVNGGDEYIVYSVYTKVWCLFHKFAALICLIP